MYDVVAMGELLIDFTPCGTGESGHTIFEQNPGGAPANVLVAMSKLGAKGAFIGKVGDDIHGALLKRTLEENGVSTKGLVIDPDVFTTLAFVELHNGDRTFSFARKPGADTMIRPEEVSTELLDEASIFHFGSLSLTDEPARSATIFAIKHAKDAGSVISYDPNYRPPLWKSREAAEEQIRSVIGYVDVMKISDEETELVSGEKDPAAAAKILLDKGVKCVVITLGGDGSMVCTKDFSVTAPALKGKAVDTTGAGDSFWGGFLYCLASNKVRPENLTKEQAEDFALFANSVAGLCVQKRGAIPAMPEKEAVLEVYHRLKKQ
ncbi:MAG: carbohydrate kinase [Eubacteriales bacterium]|jgi:fructokinase